MVSIQIALLVHVTPVRGYKCSHISQSLRGTKMWYILFILLLHWSYDHLITALWFHSDYSFVTSQQFTMKSPRDSHVTVTWRRQYDVIMTVALLWLTKWTQNIISWIFSGNCRLETSLWSHYDLCFVKSQLEISVWITFHWLTRQIAAVKIISQCSPQKTFTWD